MNIVYYNVFNIFAVRFCGPGTKLKQRLARGERGVNQLDELCRSHDIAYDQSESLADRHKADEILQEQAWKLVKSRNTGLKEKIAAYGVTNAMKAKRKLGAGCQFKSIVGVAKKAIMRNTVDGISDYAKLAKMGLMAAKKQIKKKKIAVKPRIIKVPKTGGMLPLIPILAGLSAIGSLMGGVSNIVKTAHDLKSSRSTPVHLGNGLYLKPYKGDSYIIGKGLFLSAAPRGQQLQAGAGLRGKTNTRQRAKN